MNDKNGKPLKIGDNAKYGVYVTNKGREELGPDWWIHCTVVGFKGSRVTVYSYRAEATKYGHPLIVTPTNETISPQQLIKI